jgi:hypothetical protein
MAVNQQHSPMTPEQINKMADQADATMLDRARIALGAHPDAQRDRQAASEWAIIAAALRDVAKRAEG